ncbi:putative deoxyribonuclease TATDN2 [Mercenaria mercenaria]|uniref:putative deoxyribonuclease TATDN2 n=1 Tax=Mercenaria mercenaria TaxID=6596 RepID=UPI00234F31E9|nr:putative deoxyribonuclease TATDN2 [Mercenaria mercenaria]
MRELGEVLNKREEDLTLRNHGSSVLSLIEWSRLISLVSLLRPEQRDTFRELFEPSEEEQLRLPKLAVGFDSHCHLDRTMEKLRKREKNLSSILDGSSTLPEYEIEVPRVVGVFCNPETYPSKTEIKNWVSQGVCPAIGWHPRKTSGTEEDWRLFRDRLNMPEVVALGEVGLERNEPPNQWYAQMLKLEKALDCLGPNHVLVLHCRSVGTESDEAWLTVLMILKAHQAVGRERLIHCHCFTGSRSLAERLSAEYPNTYFGFTSVVPNIRSLGTMTGWIG